MHELSRAGAGGIHEEPGRSLARSPGGHEGKRGATHRRGTGTFGRVVGPGVGHEPGQMIMPDEMRPGVVQVWRAAALLTGGMALAAALMTAQTPVSSGLILRFTATTGNVSGAPDSIRIDLLRWSTDAERDQLMNAWNMTGAAGRGGRGAARGGRGGRGGRGADSADSVPDPDAIRDSAAST